MKAKDPHWIGIDLGGTKILAAVLDSKFRILGACKNPNDPNRGEKVFLSTLKDSVDSALDQARLPLKSVGAVGAGCPGMIDFSHGTVRLSPNISFLRNYPLAKKLGRMLKRPVFIENDVNAGLYGEWQFGAAKGCRHAAGIFPGTGVGGAFILDGKLYRGSTGAAGEIGHTFLAPPSLISSEERATTVEGLLGRLRISSEASYLVLKQKARHLFQETGYDVRKIKSKALLRSVRGGDRAVRELLLQKARVLGLAMANLVNLLNPEKIVLGGGVIEAMGSLLLPEARRVMHRCALAPVVRHVQVVAARLGDDAIVKGAAKLASDWISGKEV